MQDRQDSSVFMERRGGRARWLAGAALIAPLLGSVLALASPAAAQTRAPAKSANPDSVMADVIVTARRVEERLQDVPVAVTALSQAKLDQLVVNNTGDLAKLSPGLQVMSCIPGGQPGQSECTPGIRGFYAQVGQGNGVVVPYFADAANFPTATFDLQNLQVLKGPQGTLFGDTSTGGALIYTPQKPGTGGPNFIEAEVGNYNEARVTGAFGDSFADGKVAWRLAGEYRHRDGWITGHFTSGRPDRDLGGFDNLNLRASLVWKPIDHLENYTVVVFGNSSTNGGANFPTYADPRFISPVFNGPFGIPANDPVKAAKYEFFSGALPPAGLTWGQIALAAIARQAAGGDRQAWISVDPRSESRQYGIVNQTRYDFNEHFYARNIFAIQWPFRPNAFDSNYTSVIQGTGITFSGTGAPILDRAGVRNFNSTNAYDANYYKAKDLFGDRVWTDEVQVVGDMFDGRLKAQGGLFYKKQEMKNFEVPQFDQLTIYAAGGYIYPAPCAAGSTTMCITTQRQSQETKAAYAQGTFAITDTLHFTAGARRTVVSDLEVDSRQAQLPNVNYTASNGVTITMPIVVGNPTPLPGAPIVNSPSPGSKSWTYTVSLDWKPTDGVLLYATTRKGFKPGGLNANVPPGSANANFSPESLKDLELGAKVDYAFGGVQTRSSIAIYRDWYSNIQSYTLAPGVAALILTNNGEADFHGVEFESAIQFNDYFDVTLQASWTHNRYVNRIESSSCGTQFWRFSVAGQCADLVNGALVPLPASTPITINHSAGVLTITPAGGTPRTFNFRPSRFQVSPLTWSIQPRVSLRPLTGEDISLSANIYYQSGETGIGDGPEIFAGVPPFYVQNYAGLQNGLDQFSLGRATRIDLAGYWRHVRGSNFTLEAHVTNLTDKLVREGSVDFRPTITAVPTVSDPRMYTFGLRYQF